MSEMEAKGALSHLEKALGRTPSVAEIAEQMNCSVATALKYLDRAEIQGLIIKRDGKFMTKKVAEAYKKE